MSIINPIDFLKGKIPFNEVGGLTADQVSSMSLQYAKNIGQAYNKISNDGIIGKYGLDAQKLEQLGMIKPGTSAMIHTPGFAGPLLSDKSVWTGKNGIEDLNGLLQSESVQDTLHGELLNNANTMLLKQGLINGQETAESLSGMLQGAIAVGPDAVNSLINGTATSRVTSKFANAADDAKGAIAMLSTIKPKVPNLPLLNIESGLASIKSVASNASGIVGSLIKGKHELPGALATNIPTLNNDIQFAVKVGDSAKLPNPPDMKSTVSTISFGNLDNILTSTISSTKVFDRFVAESNLIPAQIKNILPVKHFLQLPNISKAKRIIT